MPPVKFLIIIGAARIFAVRGVLRLGVTSNMGFIKRDGLSPSPKNLRQESVYSSAFFDE